MIEAMEEVHRAIKDILDESQFTLSGYSDFYYSTPAGFEKPGPSTSLGEELAETRPAEEQLEREAPLQIYTRAARKKKPPAVLKSPYLPNEVRGTDYMRFMRGVMIFVNKEYFLLIKDAKEKLGNEHIDPYVSILATDPQRAGVHPVKSRIRIVGTMFMTAIEEVWETIKRNGPIIDEEQDTIPENDLARLSMYVDNTLPEWGPLESWHDADQVIMVCYFNQHWATCVLDLVACTVEIWDSKQHIFEEHHYDIQRAAFKPVAHIVPQVLKHMRFYDKRPRDMPTFKE